MILIDANILVYACNSAADLHGKSRDWLDEKLNGANSGRIAVGKPARVPADCNEPEGVP